jgi:NADH:ubiquinone oxidoreductase subunit E
VPAVSQLQENRPANNGQTCGKEDLSTLLPVLDGIIESYQGQSGALIPVLQTIQNTCGYLSEHALRHVSRNMKIPFSEVTGVVTFYSYFSTQPRGTYLFRVCMGTACYVRGGNEVLEALQRELGIRVGETTEDRLFSLEVGRCFGACGLAPVVMVNDVVHQRVKPSRVRELVAHYREEASEGGDHHED